MANNDTIPQGRGTTYRAPTKVLALELDPHFDLRFNYNPEIPPFLGNTTSRCTTRTLKLQIQQS